MTGHVRPDAPAPGTNGHGATPPLSTRREARELERGAAVATRPRSAERRIRAVQKSYAKPATSGSRARDIGSRLLSVAAMIFAGALAVGMSVPANAFNTGATGDQTLSAATAQSGKEAGQSLDVAATATGTSAARAEYTVTSWAEMLRLQYGTRDYSYEMGDPNGAIRWPFPYPVPISSGFGERSAPCRGCSSMHMGVDFTPGEGAPIYAVAAGVVKVHDDDSGGYGNHVYIDHGNLLGDGSTIETLYAHMQHGSSALQVGDKIEVGDFIGTVGMTGTATGNHLHFEVHVNGVQVDPFAWLQANT